MVTYTTAFTHNVIYVARGPDLALPIQLREISMHAYAVLTHIFTHFEHIFLSFSPSADVPDILGRRKFKSPSSDQDAS